jgi:uncharacterized protein (DUF58 family)
MISTEFLKDLEKFSLIVRKKITSKYQGQRSSQEAGRGLTIKEHRQYTVGDDVRAIDWKVFARTDDLFVKVFEEDRDLSVHLILDGTKSMGLWQDDKQVRIRIHDRRRILISCYEKQ